MTSGQKGSPRGAATKASPRSGIKPPVVSARPSLTKSSLPVTAKTGGNASSGIPGPSRMTPTNSNTGVAPGNKGGVVVERPKPPIKQGTFTKELTADDMNKSVDELSDDTDHNGNDTSLAEGSDEALSNRKSTEIEDQEKGICEGRFTKVPVVTPPRATEATGQRATAAPQAVSWSNALGGHRFLVDTSQKEGFSAPYKQMQVQRNSNKPPLAMTTKTVATKTLVVKSSGVPGGRSLLSKKSGATLTKTSSGSSLNKSSSGSSLSQSIRSIPGARTPVRAALNKSDSSPSVNRTSRSSTPNGRRQSPAGSASSECSSSSTVTNKKAAVSKIAGLWKRDGQKTGNAKSTPVKSKSGPVKAVTPPKRTSSLKNTRRSLPACTKFHADASTSESDTKEISGQKESMPKSSTYDKLPTDLSVVNLSETGSDEADGGAVPRNPPSHGSEQSKIWRRTYTIDDVKTPSSTSAVDGKKVEPAGKSKKPSIWRRPKTKSAKSETAKIEQKTEQPKKRFSLWRRDTSEGAKGGNKAGGEVGGSKIPGLFGGENRNRNSSREHVDCDANSDRLSHEETTTGVANTPARPSTLSPLSSPPRPAQNAAIVPPFNYTPAQSTTTSKVAKTNGSIVVEAGPKQIAPPVAPSPTRPTTKTEMLMARRRSYLNSLKNESGDEADRSSKRSSCLVTTV